MTIYPLSGCDEVPSLRSDSAKSDPISLGRMMRQPEVGQGGQVDEKTRTPGSALAQIGAGINAGQRVKSPLRSGDAPPLMRNHPVQHTSAGTSEKTLKSRHGIPPSSPGISV
jgi:hypothetical protein